MIRTIPEDFLIGTSSSAWQIEGVAGKSKEQKSWAELFYASAPGETLAGFLQKVCILHLRNHTGLWETKGRYLLVP